MAQTPPPFHAPPPNAPATQSANKACLVIVVGLLAMCAVMIVIGVGFFKSVWGQVVNTTSCIGMFDVAEKAVMAYSLEHHGKFPNAATWQDDIQPYYARLYDKLKSKELPRVMLPPKAGQQLQCTWEGRVTGIAFNVEISGKEVAKVKDPATTAVVFETEHPGHNLNGKYNPKPVAKAPKVMYNERDWIVYFIAGNKNPFETSSSSASSFELTPEDGLPAKSPASGENTGVPGKSGEH